MRKLYAAHFFFLAGFLSVLYQVLFGTSLVLLDEKISNFVSRIPEAIISAPASFVAARGDFLLLAIIGAFLFIYLYGKKRVGEAVALGGALLAASFLEEFIKSIVERVRPEHATYLLSDPSFPSGHAAVATAFFLLLFVFVKKDLRRKHDRTALALICAAVIAIVAASRIILNVHWTSDVLAGMFLGGYVATLAVIVMEELGDRLVSG